MSAAEELIEAHVQDCGLELFSQYCLTLDPASTAPRIAAAGAAKSRNIRRSRQSSTKTSQNTEAETVWLQFWIAALYVGIDDLDDDYPDVQTWATALKAPLVLNVYATKFSQLNTKEQQVALILRIREAWGVDFYRKLRHLDTPVLLPRTPSHGFLTQLAKLAERQSLTDFSAHFPRWLVSFIPNSHCAAAGLASHKRGERQVGRSDITAYLNFLTTNKNWRAELIHHCPRLTFNESNKKRRKLTHTGPSPQRALQSPPHIEQPRRDTLAPLEEGPEDIDEGGTNLIDDSPPPRSPAPNSPLNATVTQDDEALDISGIDFEAETSGFESTMAITRTSTNDPRSEGPTPDSNDPLAATAIQNASALSLHERVRRRVDALKDLSGAKLDMVDAEMQLASVVSEILTLLKTSDPCQDVSCALQDAIAHETTQLAKIRKTHAALETFRSSLKDSGISEGDNCLDLLAINQPGWFNDTPAFASRIQRGETYLLALEKHKARHKDAVYDERSASHKLESAKKATEVADREYRDFVRTISALGDVNDPGTLETVLQHC